MRILMKLLTTILVISGIVGGAFFGYTYYQAKDIFNQGHNNLTRKDRPSNNDRKVNILILGSDTRGSKLGKERADTILVANIDMDHHKINLISVPRDTKVKLKNRSHKINQIHAIGGPELMQEKVEELLEIEMDYFVETNFEGFKELVDVVGGVPIDVEMRMYKPSEDIDLLPGTQHLDGSKALAYVRFRGDARADLARVERQQKFLKTLMAHTIKISNIPKIPKILQAVSDNVITNFTFDEAISLAKTMVTGRYEFSSFTVPGRPKTINGASYYLVNDQALTQFMVALDNGTLTDEKMSTLVAIKDTDVKDEKPSKKVKPKQKKKPVQPVEAVQDNQNRPEKQDAQENDQPKEQVDHTEKSESGTPDISENKPTEQNNSDTSGTTHSEDNEEPPVVDSIPKG